MDGVTKTVDGAGSPDKTTATDQIRSGDKHPADSGGIPDPTRPGLFFFFFKFVFMVTVNTTDQCKLYYEPGTSLDTYDITVLWRNCLIERYERATGKIVEVHVKTMRQKEKVSAQHRDTY